MCNEILWHYIIVYVTSGRALYFNAALNQDHFLSLGKEENKTLGSAHRKFENKMGGKKKLMKYLCESPQRSSVSSA